jgi:tetratricopeptide (TPR) repeat protein
MVGRIHVVFAVLIALAGPVQGVFAQTENTPAYREELVAMKKYAEAFQAYKDALAKDPKNATLLYNAGLMAYLTDKAKEAIEYWSRLKALEPDDWRVSIKLIQAYEAAGQLKERDAERTELFKLRKETEDPDLKKLKYYCRDQFSVGPTRIMVFEYFDLEGGEPIRLSFDLLEPAGKPVQTRYTLGSYKATNEIAREVKQIKPGERLFHLDGYKQDGELHELYQTFVGEPVYDGIKDTVKEILEGKRKPRSKTEGKEP